MTANASTHRWRFFRAGGLDQARFDSADDYRNLEHLDQKLWVALACPVKGLEFDEKTLAMIDGDKDSRVRVPEVVAAVQWAEDHLKDLGVLKNCSDSLPLDQINDQTPSGKALLASAKQILKNLGKADAKTITLADVADTAKIFAQTKFNGDGIIPVESAETPALQQVINEIISTQGGETDRSGKPGISQGKVDAFFAQLTAFDAWAKQAEATAATVSPLGDGTAAAAAAVKAVRAKVDDYFGRCRLAAFDPRAIVAVNRKEEEYLIIASKDLNISAQEVAGFPLSKIEAHRPLPLKDGINPAWADAIGALLDAAVAPLLGKDKTTLTEADWAALKAKVAPFDAWIAAKPAVTIEPLGLARIRAILATTAQADIGKLIAQDKALEAEASAIINVERLIRYHRDLHRLLCNFVNFSDFYDPAFPATFQVGTLYLDGRACELCVRVDDGGKHAALAGMAKAYLAYCDCTRPSGEKMTIAAAFTDGDSDNLLVGRNGVFYDRKGRDWDATITKIIDNPISIRQAFWAPYKKLVRAIEEQVAKRAAAAEAASDAKIAAAATATANVDKAKPAEPKKVDVGTVAAISVAIAGIGSFITALLGYITGLFAMPFWVLCLVLASLLLIISGPSMLIAWLKLRQRNLGPILDANGWAVNGRVKVPVSLGRSLTSVAKLPPGTLPSMDDKFAEPPVFWPKLLLFAIVVGFIYSLLNNFGLIHRWTNGTLGSTPTTQSISLDALLKGSPTNQTAEPAKAP
ncbi:MAG: hypothetical protein JNK85_19060 [Verrucomicrobiales bacterium]|nr:hypothetical protein [Verrucomicrobiales bacterium]